MYLLSILALLRCAFIHNVAAKYSDILNRSCEKVRRSNLGNNGNPVARFYVTANEFLSKRCFVILDRFGKCVVR